MVAALCVRSVHAEEVRHGFEAVEHVVGNSQGVEPVNRYLYNAGALVCLCRLLGFGGCRLREIFEAHSNPFPL